MLALHFCTHTIIKRSSVNKNKEAHSGIYLLPNLFTTASLFAAFYSIIASMKGNYEAAVVAIFIGMIADGLDGRIARLTNTQTDFGAQYDSLSDMVTFGVAPSILLYGWILHQFGKIGWVIAFIYTACVALRLARFNTQMETEDKRFFQGLACPPAAAVITSYAWLCQQYGLRNGFFLVITGLVTIGIAALMVSNIRYHSFKELEFRGKVPFLYLLITIILFSAIAAHPALVLFVGFLMYALSGPLYTLWKLKKIQRAK